MPLADFQPRRDFFVGIDSDGCVFDSMELKHKECFIPAFILHYGLQGASRFAREAAEFVNLYSKSRGINRFPGLIEQLDWLRDRDEVRARGVVAPRLESVRQWLAAEQKPSQGSLERAAAAGDADLALTLAWSRDVNARIAAMGANVPPFPRVRECLERMAERADIAVVSSTPKATLDEEWAEHKLAPLVRIIVGQEQGTKRETLGLSQGYEPIRRLMIGDAPGDQAAAEANDCLFFPINPGHEEESWRRLAEEGLEQFFTGRFAGDYQESLLVEFHRLLPERPPWLSNC